MAKSIDQVIYSSKLSEYFSGLKVEATEIVPNFLAKKFRNLAHNIYLILACEDQEQKDYRLTVDNKKIGKLAIISITSEGGYSLQESYKGRPIENKTVAKGKVVLSETIFFDY